MLDRIINILEEKNVDDYSIVKTDTSSVELFFVKKALDLHRAKDVCYYKTTIYIDNDDKTQRGFSTITFDSSLSDEEIAEKAELCISAAKSAMNPYYELPSPENHQSILGEKELLDEAMKLAEGLFAPCHEKAFVNSAEVFAVRHHIHMITSRGTDISYYSQSVSGEFVVQCKEPYDVELYYSYAYKTADKEQIGALVRSALDAVEARSRAINAPKKGVYDIVIDGRYFRRLFSIYETRSSASSIYAGYSDYECGDDIQGDSVGERINYVLKSNEEFDGEGIRMHDRILLSNGKLQTIHGSNRFCKYLEEIPTGTYDSFELKNGTKPMSKLLEGKVLYVVAFSDFQCDSYNGNFGGEIRLAYLYDNGKVTPLTGGSVCGDFFKQQRNMVFSLENYSSLSYNGPKAVRIADVTVAGEE